MLRRPLPRIACAYALGIALADRAWLSLDGALVLAAGALALGFLAAERARVLAAAACALALACGALALGARLDAALRHRPTQPGERTLEGTVAAVARAAAWTRLELVRVRAVSAREPPLPPRVRIYVRPEAPNLAAVAPGARLRLRARLRAPHAPSNPGARDRVRPLERRGTGAVGGLSDPRLWVRLAPRDAPTWWTGLEAARARWARSLGAAGPGGGLLAALALGERDRLEPAGRDAFRELGLSHLLAVSGLHLLLVAGAAFAVLRAALARCPALAARRDVRGPALAGAVGAAAVYALLAGWGVPVRRALVLLVAVLVAVARGQSGARAEPLAAAALWVLAADPGALFDAGAQLSFAASAALAAAAPRPDGAPAARWRRAVGDALRTSAVAIAATAPLAAAHFGQVAPLALAANLVAVPWTALVLLPAAFAAVVATALPGLPGAAATRDLAETVAYGTLRAAEAVAGALPGGAAGAVPHPVALLVAAACVPWALRARSTTGRVALAGTAGALLAAAPPAGVSPPAPRLVALDVAQGDATLVQGRDAAVLIDAGAALPGGSDWGRRVVVPALAALGVGRLDVVVATHADVDHCGGIPAVLDALPVDAVWIPFGSRGDEGFAALLAAAAVHGVPVLERGAGSRPARVGGLQLAPLWPPRRVVGSGSRNDRSLVLRIDVAGRRVLLPGDLSARAERALLATGADLRADVLLLAHHGSRSSSTGAFLRAADAALAVASAPRAGRFGMPHPEVVARARRAGLPVWWTGRDGAVLVQLASPLAAWGSARPRR